MLPKLVIVSGIADIHTQELLIMDRGTDSSELTDTISASFVWNNSDVFVLDVNRILDRVTGDTL
jgi:chemotaxis signal transduction protein